VTTLTQQSTVIVVANMIAPALHIPETEMNQTTNLKNFYEALDSGQVASRLYDLGAIQQLHEVAATQIQFLTRTKQLQRWETLKQINTGR
jgi:hypothetical protein